MQVSLIKSKFSCQIIYIFVIGVFCRYITNFLSLFFSNKIFEIGIIVIFQIKVFYTFYEVWIRSPLIATGEPGIIGDLYMIFILFLSTSPF